MSNGVDDIVLVGKRWQCVTNKSEALAKDEHLQSGVGISG